jgi:hypothetical protein
MSLLKLFLSFLSDNEGLLPNIADVFIVVQFGHDLLISSLELKHFFILSVPQSKHLIVLFFNLFLKVHIGRSRAHQDLSKIFGKQHVHDIHLFDNDTVWLKFLGHLVADLGS